MERFILAVDQGTTGNTVLVFDHDGRIRGRAYKEFGQIFPQPGWVEHDATEILNDCLQLMPQAISDAGSIPAQVAAIGIVNQRETVVCWEKESGRPVMNAIVWQDRRTAELCDRLRDANHEAAVQEKTGLLLDPYFSGTKIKWMLDSDPDLRARAARGEILVGTMETWLLWNLSGGARHATDYSNASRTLLYNIGELDWDKDLLELFGIPRQMLPEVVPSSANLATTVPELFDGARIPISGMAGDQQAALFGQACYGGGRAKNTYGTGSFLLMNTGTVPTRSQQRLLTTIAWGIGDQPVEYALEGAVFVSGAAVQWLRDGLGIISAAAETEELARSLTDNDGVYFVPALVGLGAPHWDPYARGTVIGITRGTTRAHFARAALEAICYQTRDVVDAMSRDAGIPVQEIRADGGAVVNRFLMQFQADILGVPVRVPEVTETTALGAAYLAGLAVSYWESREQIDAQWNEGALYQPQLDPQRRDELYRRWHQAVACSRSWSKPTT